MPLKSSLPAVIGFLCLGLLLWVPAGLSQNLDSSKAQGRPLEHNPFDLQQLTKDAGLIVRGILAGPQPKWIGRVIYTEYSIQVQETLKGAPRGSATLAVVGGALGNVKLAVPGSPKLQAGDQLVLFGVPLQGTSSFTPVGTFDGIVAIRPANGNIEASVAPRGKPESLESFLQEVRALSRRP